MDTLTNQPRRAETVYLGYEGRRIAGNIPDGELSAAAPGEIVHTRTSGDLVLRQIHPADWPALRRGFAGLTAEEVRLRFLHPLTELPEALARKLCDIDTEHAAAFILIDPVPNEPASVDGQSVPQGATLRGAGPEKPSAGYRETAKDSDDADRHQKSCGPEIHAVARAFIDPVTMSAEFAIVIQHALTGQGLGTLLMQRLIAASRALGATEMWGDVLAENTPMLDLAHRLGFSRHSAYQDPGVVRVTLPL